MSKRQEFIMALHNPIDYVWYCEHVMDNSWTHYDIEKAISQFPAEYLPIGVCDEPEYSPRSGRAFVFEDRRTGDRMWVHIPLVVIDKWRDNYFVEELVE